MTGLLEKRHSTPIRMPSRPQNPLPVVVHGDEDESGLSFVMRALHANGMSMEQARAWLGIKSWYSLNRQELSLLAWKLGVSQDWLRRRTLGSKTSGSAITHTLMGCNFVSVSLRKPTIAAVCPDCVRIKGFCCASWLLKCIVVCPAHAKPILERCAKCGQMISWLRPAIDVCNCGRYLGRPRDEELVTDQLIAWVRWIEWRLGLHIDSDGEIFSGHIPQILNEMSLDGAMRLVVSFGLLEDPAQSVRVGSWRTLGNEGAIGVVTRGLFRLGQLDSSQDSFAEVGTLVHLPILERMRNDGVESADILNASNLVAALQNKSYMSWDRRVKFPHGQLSLFSWRYK